MTARAISARVLWGFFRSLSALLLSCAVLAPVVGAGAVLADDLSDLAIPGDDPATPGPDLYHGRSLDDGIPDMPSLVTIAPPLASVAFTAPVGLAQRAALAAAPSCPSREADASGPSRAPPSLPS